MNIGTRSNSSIWPKDGGLSDTTTPSQGGPGSNGNEEVLHISQSFGTGASAFDFLVPYPGHSLYSLAPQQRWSRCILLLQCIALIKISHKCSVFASYGILADHRVKLKESEKRDKYLDLARELEKATTMEQEGDGNTNCN